jgi:hypothetical protein
MGWYTKPTPRARIVPGKTIEGPTVYIQAPKEDIEVFYKYCYQSPFIVTHTFNDNSISYKIQDKCKSKQGVIPFTVTADHDWRITAGIGLAALITGGYLVYKIRR